MNFLKKLNWKLIGISLGAVLGVLVLAAGLFIAFFPKDLAAREAERRIEEATDRDLVLGGNVELTFWPALGFSVDQVSLSNPRDFDSVARRGGVEAAETPFLAADRIVFAVAVMPLLRGEIQVKDLILQGADVQLRAKEDGTSNWTFPTDEEEDETTLEDLRLDNVQLIDSMITFQGAEDEAPLTFEDVDATLALESLDSPAQIQAALTYRAERLNVDAGIGLPRAVLEKGETPITAQLRSAPLEVDLSGTFNAETGALNGAIQANGASVRRLLAWVGSPMAEGDGFGAYRVTGQMAREGETTALTELALRMDAIEANGALNLINQENGRLRVTGVLNAPTLDLNTYLPAPAQGDGSGVEVDTAWSADPLDLSGLRALDADLNLTLGALRFQRMSFTNVALALRVANGAADARLTRIALYDGGGTARLIADGAGPTPRIAIELNAENIQAETLLRDAIGFDKIVGRGRLTASLVGTGASQAAIMRSLRGTASFNFNDGQYKGVNLAQMARTLQSFTSGQQAQAQGNATDFAELSANFAVSEGVAATDSLRMLNPFVRLEGRGLINIGSQTVDMRLTPRAVRSIEGQGGDATVAGLGIPFRVSGPWSRVSFRPALEDVVQNQLRDILSRQGGDNPLGSLGEALFGRTPPGEATTETPTPTAESGDAAPTPAPEEERQRPRNPLEEILRRATERNQQKQETPTPAPSTP
ncbi:AsmA family protein [Terricaulis silvestris]|uniref:Putative assembly protein n=1 Tax=Terricaulis silvestris TaxID=2686094 RepID=A0A6I6MVF6_9CAUL|nr:AsmA family protein [Terricaulis silvestris]QGZ96747.1 putative assembly protein [Terricaulis silvestris]